MKESHSHFTNSASIFSISLLVVEIILGLAGNLGLLVLVGRGKTRKKVSHWLVLSLCSMGTICCGIGIPSFLATFAWHYLQGTHVFRAVCGIRYGIMVFSFFANSFTICALSLERYDSILRPFRKRITLNNVKQYITAIWTISITIGIVSIIDMNSKTCILLRSKDGVQSSLVLGLAGLTVVATAAIVILTYLRGIRSMRKISSRLRQTTSNSMKNATKRNYTETQVTRLVSKILFFYLLSWLPTTLWHPIARFGSLDPTIASDTQLCLFVISFTNYVTNPFIYMGNASSKLGKVAPRLSGRPERRACNDRQNSVFIVEDELSRVNDELVLEVEPPVQRVQTQTEC